MWPLRQKISRLSSFDPPVAVESLVDVIFLFIERCMSVISTSRTESGEDELRDAGYSICCGAAAILQVKNRVAAVILRLKGNDITPGPLAISVCVRN